MRFITGTTLLVLRVVAICSCHVTDAFQSEFTLNSCLNVKELVARSTREIWDLNDCNWTRTQNHLVCKQTLNHLAKLVKWLSCVLSTYLYGAFDCMFLSCHIRVSEWIHTLQLPECQGTPCSKQAQNLRFKWLQLDSNLVFNLRTKWFWIWVQLQSFKGNLIANI